MTHSHKHGHKSRSKSKHLSKLLPAPKVKDVDEFLQAATRYYKKRRYKVEKEAKSLLKKYHISGTNNEEYWRLKAVCIMLGQEVAYLPDEKK
jgi:hypothetical protein